MKHNYATWKEYNAGRLRVKYNEYMDEKYTPIQPDTYVSFDDYCMGRWQCRYMNHI